MNPDRAPNPVGTELPPLGVYVHLPWCVRKCPYCDFNSHPLHGEVPEAAYLSALIDDLRDDLASAAGRPVRSVFFGGGTPSLFSADGIGQLLDTLAAETVCASDMEVTLEANPGTVEHGRFADLRAAGVNRLSIGVQSFAPDKLAALGRIHDGEQARMALREVRNAGFDDFNVDLMFGLPGQTVEEALHDVESAGEFEPSHVSHYQLTIEPNTVFHKTPPVLPDEDVCWSMQRASREALADRGYESYEVSAYAQAGRECRHNVNYWRFGDYLGIGAGAHGKLSDADGAIVRSWKLRSPRAYMAAGTEARRAGRQTLSAADTGFEFMLNALRLSAGFCARDFEARTGQPFAAVAATLGEAENDGLMSSTGTRWRTTALGARFLNDLQARFLP